MTGQLERARGLVIAAVFALSLILPLLAYVGLVHNVTFDPTPTTRHFCLVTSKGAPSGDPGERFEVRTATCGRLRMSDVNGVGGASDDLAEVEVGVKYDFVVGGFIPHVVAFERSR